MQVTATERRLVEYYRKADSDTKKSAMRLLKGEDGTVGGIVALRLLGGCGRTDGRSRSGRGFEGSEAEIEIQSKYEWYMLDSLKKYSSLYSILAIRMKLQLMGLDYVRKADDPDFSGLRSNEEYFGIYAGDDRPEVDRKLETLRRVEIYAYRNVLGLDDFRSQTLRKNLLIQEHLRWNAFMLSCGFVPASARR